MLYYPPKVVTTQIGWGLDGVLLCNHNKTLGGGALGAGKCFLPNEHLFTTICGKKVVYPLHQSIALNVYPVTAYEAHSECKAPQRDVLGLSGTFGVDPEKATPGRPWDKATAAMFPAGQAFL